MDIWDKYSLILWEHWCLYVEIKSNSNKFFHPFRKYVHLFLDGYERPYVIPYYVNVMILQFGGSLETIHRVGIDRDYDETTDEGDDDNDDYDSDDDDI